MSAPGSAPLSSRSTQDYIKVFEQLFQRALETQSAFGLYMDQLETVPFMWAGLSIDTQNTKSFKDLCVKLVDQIKAVSDGYINCHQDLLRTEHLNKELVVKLETQRAQV